MKANAPPEPKPEVFNPYKKSGKESYEKSESPEKVLDTNEESKKESTDDYSQLEETMKKNNELFIRHKIDPNRPDKKHKKKKRRGENKMKVKQEEFPGLPGS